MKPKENLDNKPKDDSSNSSLPGSKKKLSQGWQNVNMNDMAPSPAAPSESSWSFWNLFGSGSSDANPNAEQSTEDKIKAEEKAKAEVLEAKIRAEAEARIRDEAVANARAEEEAKKQREALERAKALEDKAKAEAAARAHLESEADKLAASDSRIASEAKLAAELTAASELETIREVEAALKAATAAKLKNQETQMLAAKALETAAASAKAAEDLKAKHAALLNAKSKENESTKEKATESSGFLSLIFSTKAKPPKATAFLNSADEEPVLVEADSDTKLLAERNSSQEPKPTDDCLPIVSNIKGKSYKEVLGRTSPPTDAANNGGAKARVSASSKT